MSVTGETVVQIAALAKLRVDDQQVEEFTDRFNTVLGLFDALAAAPTDGVRPLANPLDSSQRLRPDTVTEDNQRESLQATAPSVDSGHYLVPRVVE